MQSRFFDPVRHLPESGRDRHRICHVPGLDDPGGIFLDSFPKRQMERVPGDRIKEGGRFARDNGCDFVVALGGGPVMDAAKIMAMYALQPGDLGDYVAGATGKMQPLVNPTLPIIAITTTAGTGSEVDQWGVVKNPETNEKIGCGGMDSLFPVIAVADPELMVTVPPKFTAYQGFDALFHSTEGYMSGVTSLMGDMVQLAAIENIGKYLARAVKDGSDMEAREHVAFANTMSGYSMVVGACTSEHAMEHAMSAYHQDLPHGTGSGQD